MPDANLPKVSVVATATELRHLATRVEIVTGIDAEVDAIVFDGLSMTKALGGSLETYRERRNRPNWLPAYTGSVDAVMNLVEGHLPGSSVVIGHDSISAAARIRFNIEPIGSTEGRSPSLARALLAATLRGVALRLDQQKTGAAHG